MQSLSYSRRVPLAALLFISAVACSFAAEPKKADDPAAVAWRSRERAETPPVTDTQWDEYARDVPEWFQDAKFGIYAHWGPYNLGMETAGFSGMNNS